MDSTQLILKLTGTEGTPNSGSLTCLVQVGDFVVELTPELGVTLPIDNPEVSVNLSVVCSGEVIATASALVSTLLTESQDSVSLSNGIILHLERMLRRKPSLKPVAVPQTHCEYLTIISQTQQLSESIDRIVGYLQDSLGPMYEKVLQDSVRLRSPTKSPARKAPNASKKSQGPRSSRPVSKKSSEGAHSGSPYARGLNAKVAPSKPTTIEVPANNFLTFENVSCKDFDGLVQLVLGLGVKKQEHLAWKEQATATQSLVKSAQEGSNVIMKSLEETLAQYSEQGLKYQAFLDMLKDLKHGEMLAEVNKQLAGDNEMKEGLSLVLLKQSKPIFDSDNESLVQELVNAQEQLFFLKSERDILSSEFLEEITQFNSSLQEIERDTLAQSQEKNRLHTALNYELHRADEQKQSIRDLKNGIAILKGKFTLESASKEKITKRQADQAAHQQQSQSLAAELSGLNSIAAENIDQSQELSKFLQEEINSLESTRSTLSNEQKEWSDTNHFIQTLLANTKKILTACDLTLKKLKSRANSSTIQEKTFWNSGNSLEAAWNELDYLSSFTLKWLEKATVIHRTHKNIKTIKIDRDHEHSSMLHSAYELKKQNPQYFGDKSDPLDMELEKSLNQSDHTLLVPFKKVSPGVYIFGTKQTLLKFERGKLQAKVGGGFLPLEHFIESYQYVEKDKLESKPTEYSPTAKKFMGKWAEGVINPRERSPERMRDSLVDALENHSRSPCLAVRDTIKRSKTMGPVRSSSFNSKKRS